MPWLKDDPILKFLADGRNAELEDFIMWQDPVSKKRWWAWKKMKTDGMSNPFWAWSLLGLTPLTGPGRDAWFLHDAAYSKATDTTVWASLVSPARAAGDRVGRLASQDDGLDVVRAWIVYLALRVGGWAAWMQHGKENSWRRKNQQHQQ